MMAWTLKNERLTGVVGLDLSLKAAGIVRIGCEMSSDGECKRLQVEGDTIGTEPGYGELWRRYRYSMEEIRKRIGPDDVVFIEDYAFKAFGSSIVTLAELGGLVKMMLKQRTGIWPVTVSPSTVKKFLKKSGQKGQIKKDMMPVEVHRKFGVECESHDEYVAYALAELGWQALGLPIDRKPTTFEEEAVDTVVKRMKKEIE